MNFGVVQFAFRSKRGLLLLLMLLLLSWQSPSLADMDDIDSLLKTPLCQGSNSTNASSVIKVSCRGAGLTRVPGNLHRFNESLEEM